MRNMDPRARQIINEAYESSQFNQLPALCDIRARLLFSAHDNAHASTEGACLNFKDALSKMHVKSSGDEKMGFDEQFANVECLTAENIWALTTTVSCMPRNY